jgi:hypothetical protein
MATRHKGHAFFVTNPDDRLHIRGRLRQHHELGQAAQVRESVALIRDQLHRVGEDSLRSDRTPELVDELLLH